MDWVYLFIAGGLETFWAVSLKFSHGFSRPLPSALTLLGMAASFGFLSLALKGLPLATAYAVWTGIGMTGTFLVGVFFLHETATPPQWGCVAMIAAGIIGLRILSR